MQKVKIIQIGHRSFTLKELPVRLVRELMNNENRQDSMLDRCQELLGLACPELDVETMIDMYPSEIEELWHGFEEVNAAFLGVIRLVGIDRAIIENVKMAVSSSIGQFAISLPQGTVPESGTTDSASS